MERPETAGAGGHRESTSVDPAYDRFLGGDARTVRYVSATIRSIGRGHGVTHDAIADLCSQVVLEVVQACSRPEFDRTGSLMQLVRTLAHWRAIDWLRRRRVRRWEELPPDMPDPSTGVDGKMMEGERLTLALDVARRLGSGCRELMRLRFGERLNQREIAELQGRSHDAVRAQMSACFRKARRLRETIARSAARRRGGPDR